MVRGKAVPKKKDVSKASTIAEGILFDQKTAEELQMEHYLEVLELQEQKDLQCAGDDGGKTLTKPPQDNRTNQQLINDTISADRQEKNKEKLRVEFGLQVQRGDENKDPNEFDESDSMLASDDEFDILSDGSDGSSYNPNDHSSSDGSTYDGSSNGSRSKDQDNDDEFSGVDSAFDSNGSSYSPNEASEQSDGSSYGSSDYEDDLDPFKTGRQSNILHLITWWNSTKITIACTLEVFMSMVYDKFYKYMLKTEETTENPDPLPPREDLTFYWGKNEIFGNWTVFESGLSHNCELAVVLPEKGTGEGNNASKNVATSNGTASADPQATNGATMTVIGTAEENNTNNHVAAVQDTTLTSPPATNGATSGATTAGPSTASSCSQTIGRLVQKMVSQFMGTEVTNPPATTGPTNSGPAIASSCNKPVRSLAEVAQTTNAEFMGKCQVTDPPATTGPTNPDPAIASSCNKPVRSLAEVAQTLNAKFMGKCPRCKDDVAKRDIQFHMVTTCPERKTHCPHCNEPMSGGDLDCHLPICPAKPPAEPPEIRRAATSVSPVVHETTETTAATSAPPVVHEMPPATATTSAPPIVHETPPATANGKENPTNKASNIASAANETPVAAATITTTDEAKAEKGASKMPAATSDNAKDNNNSFENTSDDGFPTDDPPKNNEINLRIEIKGERQLKLKCRGDVIVDQLLLPISKRRFGGKLKKEQITLEFKKKILRPWQKLSTVGVQNGDTLYAKEKEVESDEHGGSDGVDSDLSCSEDEGSEYSGSGEDAGDNDSDGYGDGDGGSSTGLKVETKKRIIEDTHNPRASKLARYRELAPVPPAKKKKGIKRKARSPATKGVHQLDAAVRANIFSSTVSAQRAQLMCYPEVRQDYYEPPADLTMEEPDRKMERRGDLFPLVSFGNYCYTEMAPKEDGAKKAFRLQEPELHIFTGSKSVSNTLNKKMMKAKIIFHSTADSFHDSLVSESAKKASKRAIEAVAAKKKKTKADAKKYEEEDKKQKGRKTRSQNKK